MYRILTSCLMLGLVHTENVTYKDGGFKYVDTNLPIDGGTCQNICISKCCSGTKVLVENICAENVYGVNIKKITVDIYSKDFKLNIMKNLSDFTFVHHDDFVDGSSILEIGPSRKAYLLETGQLIYRELNYLKQWHDPVTYREFCIEAQVSPETIELVYKYILSDGSYEVNAAVERKNIIDACVMLISCFFLLLVLVVYAMLPRKRVLTTLMRTAYVLCLISAFIMIPIQVFTEGQLAKSQCIAIGLIGYYTLLASFSWMNVMSYDLWLHIGKYRPPDIPLAEVLPEFYRYSFYGFGAPLLATLFLVGIDYADLTTVPDFVKPHFVFGEPTYCYFESDDERRLYVNAPILVMTVINIVFFIMTALIVKRRYLKPGGNDALSSNTKKDQSSFLIYLKLTLIMGLNWIFDVMGAVISPDSWVWYLPDIFNSLIGLFIFIIFICDKETLNFLRDRFLKRTKTERDITLQTSYSKSTSQSSKETGKNTVPGTNSKEDKF